MTPQAELSLFITEMVQLLLSDVWRLTHAIRLSSAGQEKLSGEVCIQVIERAVMGAAELLRQEGSRAVGQMIL